MPPRSAVAVSFSSVTRVFGDVKAVDNVSFEVRDGEFFSMLGPSGSGKTTCLRLIAGFERPDAGHIAVHGVNVERVPPYERDVNTVFQDYALFPHMTVFGNVEYGLMIRKVPAVERRQRSAEMLSLVKLEGLGNRRPSQLSGGQRQRVALARALINRPSVLLLDEPLGALDLKLREQMQEELKALQRQVGITFIYVTHDQGEALAMSDRLAVFNHGRIEQVGAPGQVYEHPATAFVAGFVGVSDGWQDLRANKRLSQIYTRAENGNVAVTGEIDLVSSDGTFIMALGFGPTAMEAGQHALISLLEDFDDVQGAYVRGWHAWHARLNGKVPAEEESRLYRISAALMRTHESKRVEGGIIASLSIPWGFSKPDDDLGGYHLVWPRDLVETAGGFIAIGAHEHVRRVLRYLQVTQEADGHWSQNMWLDGTPYWHGIQMDETALPILLVDLAYREGVLDISERGALWPMVRRAAAFLVRNGPVSP